MKNIELKPDVEVNVRPTVKLGGDKIYGYASMDLEKPKIVISRKKGDVVNTIIHEKLHINYPNMDHDKVYENAAKIEGAMTLPEMANQLLEVHARSMNPPYKRDIVHTEYSSIISRKIY